MSRRQARSLRMGLALFACLFVAEGADAARVRSLGVAHRARPAQNAPANNGGAAPNAGAPAGGAIIESSRSYVFEIVIVVTLCGGALWAVCKSAHRV